MIFESESYEVLDERTSFFSTAKSFNLMQDFLIEGKRNFDLHFILLSLLWTLRILRILYRPNLTNHTHTTRREMM